jgi:hypothetical protein
MPYELLPLGTADFMGNLPNPVRRCLSYHLWVDLPSVQVETLMCYIGIGDTATPAHKDLCASSGQNLMCYTENNGSAFWFMTKNSDAAEAADFFHRLEQELDHEAHFVTIKSLAEAKFDVYVAEQKLGDLVLVPPRSCQYVTNAILFLA